MKEIKKYLEKRTGKYSFYFEDLEGGYSYGFNEHEPMTSAGCMKLPIAVAVIKEEELNKLSFLDKIKINEKDKVFGTGIIHEFGERDYTIFELLVAMLIQSDNTAANRLIDIVSMERINEIIKELGLLNTKLNRRTRDEREPQTGLENITSAYDLSLIWKHLHDASYLEEKNSTMLIDILTRQQIRNKLSLYIPEECKYVVASKTGDKKSVENDTQLIHLSKGDFTFSVMAEGVPNSVYGTVTLAKAGKMMWDFIMNEWH